MLEGMKTDAVLREVLNERLRQERKWGQQNHPVLDPTLMPGRTEMQERYDSTSADVAKQITDHLADRGEVTYMDILIEEVREAVEAPNPKNLREELVQTAAVAVAMIESLDRNELAQQPRGHVA